VPVRAVVRDRFIKDWNESLEDIALRLAETPILPLGGASSIELARQAFGNR